MNSESFTNSDGSRTFTIRTGNFNCNSNFVVYRLVCKTCDKQDIGSTKTAYRLGLNNYKSHFRSFCEGKYAGTLQQSRVPQVVLLSSFYVRLEFSDHR